jgi:hypothetical protein
MAASRSARRPLLAALVFGLLIGAALTIVVALGP